MQKRVEYLDYVAAAPRPSVVVIEDKDEPAGYGAFWGEVQTNVHKALGCLGTVTNGSIPDVCPVESIDAMAAALDGLMQREANIIAAARAPGATAATIKAAMKG